MVEQRESMEQWSGAVDTLSEIPGMPMFPFADAQPGRAQPPTPHTHGLPLCLLQVSCVLFRRRDVSVYCCSRQIGTARVMVDASPNNMCRCLCCCATYACCGIRRTGLVCACCACSALRAPIACMVCFLFRGEVPWIREVEA